MDQARWNNIARARESYTNGHTYANGRPLEGFFEISARCNLRCQMCAINYDGRYKPSAHRRAFFEPDLFAKLRPIFPTLYRASLFGLGEPMLNRNMIDYIAELADAGVEVVFTTNGTLIDEKKAEEIARAGATRVMVSIDGATAATYEEVRRGGRFDAVVRGIRSLAEAGAKYGRPSVDLSYVAMRCNFEEIPKVVALCADLGAGAVHVEPLLAQVGSPELDDHYARENLGLVEPARVAAAFEEAQEIARNRGIRFGSRFAGEHETFDYPAAVRQTDMTWACCEPWAAIWVTSEGEVRTCCLNDTTFGNLFEQSIDDVWNGEIFRRFRSQHARHEPADGCANCFRNGRVRSSTFFRPTQPVTYFPYFETVPAASPNDAVIFDTPRAGASIADPIVITGRLAEGVAAIDVDVVIDYTPIANVNDKAVFDARTFTMTFDVPDLTEGAHVLWARRHDDPRGYAHRDVHFWRPDRSVTQASPSLLRPAPASA
jgi:MoaA/NifB/PqqE/SkfB family radical SAM enzyme